MLDLNNLLTTGANALQETLNGPVITPYEFIEIVEFYYLNNTSQNGKTTIFKDFKDFQSKFKEFLAIDAIPKNSALERMKYYKKRIRYIPKVQSYPSINNPVGMLNSLCSGAHKAVSQCSALMNKFTSNSSMYEYGMYANTSDSVNIGAWSGLGTMADETLTNLLFIMDKPGSGQGAFKYTEEAIDAILQTLPMRMKPIILISEQYNVNSTVSSEEINLGNDFDKYEQNSTNIKKMFQTRSVQHNVSHVRNETLNVTLFSTNENLLLNWLDCKLKKWVLTSDTDEGQFSYNYIQEGSLFLKDYQLQIINEDQFNQLSIDKNYKTIKAFEEMGNFWVARCIVTKDGNDMNQARIRYLFDYESKKTKMMGLKLLGYNYTTDTRGDGVTVQLSFERSVNGLYNFLYNTRSLTESGGNNKGRTSVGGAEIVSSDESGATIQRTVNKK